MGVFECPFFAQNTGFRKVGQLLFFRPLLTAFVWDSHRGIFCTCCNMLVERRILSGAGDTVFEDIAA